MMMGLEIHAKPGPIPRDLIVRLVCDGDHHGLFRADIFEMDGWDLTAMRSAATAMGWRETYGMGVMMTMHGPRVGVTRLFLCPECGRKNQRSERA